MLVDCQKSKQIDTFCFLFSSLVMRKFFVLYLCFVLLLPHFSVADDIVSIEDDVMPDTEIETPEDDKEEEEKDEEEQDAEEIIGKEDSGEQKNDQSVASKETEENALEETLNDPAQGEKNTREEVQNPPTPKTVSAQSFSDEQKEDEEEVPTIRINEVLANPDGTDSGNEFIELYNDGDDDVSLKDWRLYDKTEKPYVFDDVEIKAKEFFVLYNKKDFSFALNNSNEKIVLEDDQENIISEYSYDTSTSGLSWNYGEMYYLESPTPGAENSENPLTKDYPEILINEIFPNPEDEEENNEFIELYNPNDEDVPLENWMLRDASQSGKHVIENVVIPANDYFAIYRSTYSFALNNSGDETVSLIAPNSKTMSSISYDSSREKLSLNRASAWYWEKPTPGAENRENPLIKTFPQLLLSEVLPNPSGDENADEYIEIYNPNDTAVDLEGWTLKDASSTGSYTFFDSLLIQPHSYHVIYRKEFSFALNNSDEMLSLIAPNTKVMSAIVYESSREDISHNFNLETKQWRQSKHRTPGEKNIFNNLPEITKFEIDSKVYKDVYTEFEAKAYDKDKEELKVRWDFGDDHRSYKWETRHKYEETGTYYGSLRIQDESEEITKDFTVTVKKYPKHDIVITKIVPNPAGKDTGNEYIVIKNKEDEKINLKNWSIATGSTKKTLTNHPIYDDLTIKPGKTKIITKDHAAISLPNKTGVIEIRRPNGSVSDKIKYGEKDVSIPDNASYEIVDGQWQWIIPVDLEKQREIDAIVAQALANERMFSQQILEREIAYNAIHNPQKKKENAQNSTRNFSRTNFFATINQLLNSLIAYVQKNVSVLAQSNEETRSIAEIYPIRSNENPCNNLHIPTSKEYTFCK
jgi:hypothetical protein